MGYCINVVGMDFTIKADKKPGALKALKELAKKELAKKKEHYSYVSSDNVLAARDLYAAMQEWSWEPEEDDLGNIVRLDFNTEKLGDELILFNTIAPFVEKGSYIEIRGEDGDLWRWVFDGKTCEENSSPPLTNKHGIRHDVYMKKPYEIRIAGVVSMEVRNPKGKLIETMEPFCYRVKKELPKGKKFVIRCGVEAV